MSGDHERCLKSGGGAVDWDMVVGSFFSARRGGKREGFTTRVGFFIVGGGIGIGMGTVCLHKS